MKKTLFLSLAVVLTIVACSNNNSKSYKSTGPYYGGERADDGYVLPAMPDSKTNDKTLLGIDSNSNGIRDDVEIYIYNRFQGYTNSKVEREIAKQWARRAQQTLISPETAYEDGKRKFTERVIDCEYYYYDVYLKNMNFQEYLKYTQKHDVFNAEFKDIVFNTKDRLKAYFKYNKSMSGHVFEGRKRTKEACDFDPDPLIEGTL